ncbi:MAG: aldolase/citrate lyase family protein [Methylovirgula sp.]|uniref:aldolase/citrate lyase family protein n=1 Tax=Methylovirgula sp. TaxID=1978224 RepID=UPI0030760B45
MRVHLFVPSDPATLDKAAASGADALWLKGPIGADALRAAQQRAANPKLYVCLGALNGAFDNDLDAAMCAAPDGIVLPTCNGADVQHLGIKLAVREAELGLADGATQIIALVAASGTIFQLGSFVSASPRLVALAFDAQAFAASLEIADLSAPPLDLARNLTLLAARAAGVAAILADDAVANSPDAGKAAKRDGFDAILVRDPADIASARANLK